MLLLGEWKKGLLLPGMGKKEYQIINPQFLQPTESLRLNYSTITAVLPSGVIPYFTEMKTQVFNQWPLRYPCSTLPNELTSQLGACRCCGFGIFMSKITT